MKKIGLLSDTHAYLDERIFEHFAQCDEVWHAGDWGSTEVVERLRAFKPLRGVWGNIDSHDIRAIFPEHNRFLIEDVKVWITHIGGYPGKYDANIKSCIYANPPKLFICGHSHILKIMNDANLHILHVNPGAAGISGFHTVRTAVRFTLDNGIIKDMEVIELANRI